MIDLNLFRVFDAVMRHRSVREASRMLSVTPSAASHALRRLRQALHDELFISTGSGMQPTRRALEVAPAIREGLEKLELALIAKEPGGTEALRTFHIAATDYACMVVLPQLVKRSPRLLRRWLCKCLPAIAWILPSASRPAAVISLSDRSTSSRGDYGIGSYCRKIKCSPYAIPTH
ncbi:MAG: LysR family transcriptional regulator [Verrucomicrobia bacterium]|nr:LysR family transcriptional regulator [Verrucomicrobiota bacterium]